MAHALALSRAGRHAEAEDLRREVSQAERTHGSVCARAHHRYARALLNVRADVRASACVCLCVQSFMMRVPRGQPCECAVCERLRTINAPTRLGEISVQVYSRVTAAFGADSAESHIVATNLATSLSRTGFHSEAGE